jgi:membrane protein YqaA with SNARE-associated domain
MIADTMRALRRWARSREGAWGLFAASFLEATLVPVPFEAILVPMLLVNRSRSLWIATVASLGAVLGGVAGYAAGFFAYETVGRMVVSALDMPEQFRAFQRDLQDRGFWLIVAASISPVPFQVVTVASGVAAHSFGSFVVAISLGRAVRYYGLALLTALFGETVRDIIAKYSSAARIIVLGLIAAGVAYAFSRHLG